MSLIMPSQLKHKKLALHTRLEVEKIEGSMGTEQEIPQSILFIDEVKRNRC